MKNKFINKDYQDLTVTFTNEGWFCATTAALKYNIQASHWLTRQDTREYIKALDNHFPEVKRWYLTKKGQGVAGTWMHPKLAVPFLRWLDPGFAIWCDAQIDGIIREGSNWDKNRALAASSYKVMSEILQSVRLEKGKDTEGKHFMSEAKLVNWCLKGEFAGIDREILPANELDMLGKLEAKNCVLLGLNKDYATRKIILKSYAEEIRCGSELLVL